VVDGHRRGRVKPGLRVTGRAETSGPLQLTFREVGPDTWADMERLFEAPGGPKYCWCMVWRATPEEARRRDGPSRKRAMRKRVRAGVPVGILAYRGGRSTGQSDGQPVAWCSIAPRSTYRPLGGPEPAPGENIWSLVCFFAARPLRGRGLTAMLIREAEAYARRRGATILEAYPVEHDSPSYRFMGQVETFRKAGYREVGRAGIRRHVMRKSLTD
jgi:GNAT superfamily N-acetyltransferase